MHMDTELIKDYDLKSFFGVVVVFTNSYSPDFCHF